MSNLSFPRVWAEFSLLWQFQLVHLDYRRWMAR
jgi:hypothetical protein